MKNTLIRVSVVEDKAEWRKEAVKIITSAPNLRFVSEYAIPEDALIGLGKDQPDIVIMDIDFKSSTMTGIKCVLHLKQKYPEMKFLMFTVFDKDNKLFEALEQGADGYILKRDVYKIADAINDIYNGGASMSPDMMKRVVDSMNLSNRNQELLETLTSRQIEILELLATGMQYIEIADALNPPITVDGLRVQVSRLYRKLQVNNRTEALNVYFGRRK